MTSSKGYARGTGKIVSRRPENEEPQAYGAIRNVPPRPANFVYNLMETQVANTENVPGNIITGADEP